MVVRSHLNDHHAPLVRDAVRRAPEELRKCPARRRSYTRLVDRGWRIYHYTKRDVHGGPQRIIAELARALGCPLVP